MIESNEEICKMKKYLKMIGNKRELSRMVVGDNRGKYVLGYDDDGISVMLK